MATITPDYLGVFPITIDATGKVLTVDTNNIGYYQDTMTFSPGTGVAVVKGFDQTLPIGIEFAIHDNNPSIYRAIETCQFVPTGTDTGSLSVTVVNAMLNTDWYDVGMAMLMTGSDDSVAYNVGMRTWADGTITTLGNDYSAIVELIACPVNATFDVTVRVFWEQTEQLSGIVDPWQGYSGLTEVEVWTTSAPVVTLTFISTTRISHIEGHTQCVAKFVADRDILQWEARANGTGPGTGFLVGQGVNPVTANTEVQFEIDDTELPEADGGYDIYVYVQDTATGQWA